MKKRSKTAPKTSLEAALLYAADLGWHVFPAKIRDGKKYSHKSADRSGGLAWGMTRDPDQIRRDFARWPRCVGVPTGATNKIIVVEADTVEGGHRHDGLAEVRKLERKHGALPETLTAESPSGSVHRYYRHPGGRVGSSSSKIAPGVDVKGDGGMVVAPPSRLPDGRAYRWLNWGAEIADAPPWLVDAVLEDARSSTTGGLGSNREPAEVADVVAALGAIPNEDVSWEEWNRVGMAAFVATGGSSEGLDAFHGWSRKSEKYDQRRTAEKWDLLATSPPSRIGAGTLFWLADASGAEWRSRAEGESVEASDFYAYMEMHNYIFTPTRATWPAASVNARVRPIRDGKDEDGKPKYVRASSWLDQNRPVEQLTWAPGYPVVIVDKLVSDGGWVDRKGVSVFNLYKPPSIRMGDARGAHPWLDHVRRIYPDDADHLIAWLAHRVQRPQEKVNHSIVLGGEPGIGKDTIIEPVKRAVGPWNVAEINPTQALGRFNGFLKSVILRISEARDLGEANRYQLYEHLKPYIASPPDVLRVDEKNMREYNVFNCTAVAITANREDSLYIPADDRRYYVAWSSAKSKDFEAGYWDDLYEWFEEGGAGHVASLLSELDLSSFNSKAPPPKTAAFWRIVDLNRAPEDDELADVLDKMGRPDATTSEKIWEAADGPEAFEFRNWLSDRKNSRALPHRLSECGYASVRSTGTKDGKWVVGGSRRVVYVRKDLSVRDQHVAARALVKLEEGAKSLRDNGIIPFDPRRKR